MGKNTNQIATFADLQSIGYRIPSAITNTNHCVTYSDFITMNNETDLTHKTKTTITGTVTDKQAVKWSNVPGSTAVSFTGDNTSSTWNTLTSVPVTFAVNEYTTSSTEREMCRIWIYRHGQSFHQLAVLYLTNQNPEQTIYLPINLARMNSSYNEVLEFNIESSTYYTPYDYVKLTTKNGLDVASGPYVSFAYPTQYLNQTFNNYTDCIQQLYRVDIYKNAFTI